VFRDFTPDMGNTRVESHYFHASVPEHKAALDDQAKNPLIPREGNGEKVVSMQRVAEIEKPRKRRGVVYERRRIGDEGEKEQPERLVTVQDVVDTLSLPPSTVKHWVATGRLKERGRIWLGKPGGHGTPLVSESEAESLKNNPPPMGRPRKRKK
jgi:hypothetical protein